MSESALKGLKVVEYAQSISGPYCSKLLADLGAEVIKIEPPKVGDVARKRGPFAADIPDPEQSGLFLYVNYNKMGITLDVGTRRGKMIFNELLKNADVLVEDTPPGMLASIGLGYDTLLAANSRLVMTSITPFGQSGPYRDYKAYPLNTFHAGGEGYITPISLLYLDRPPLKLGGQIGEFDCGVGAAVATMLALYERENSGQGQHVDVSKQEALISQERVLMDTYPNTGTVVTRDRLVDSGGVMACQDGHVLAMIANTKQWQALVDFMGNPEWARDERFMHRGGRIENALEISMHVEEWMADHTKSEIYLGGQARGCPFAPIDTVGDAVNSEQFKVRGFFQELTHPVAGKLRYPTAPYRFTETPVQVNRPAPLLGEHNEEIYCGRLRYTRKQLARMRQAGII